MIPNYQIRQPRRSGWRTMVLGASLLGLLAGGFLVYSYLKIHRAGSSESEPVTFSVPKGASTREVGERLDEEELISGPKLFVAYAMLTGASGKIQAGDYQLDRNMSMSDILGVLSSGKVTKDEKRAVIVEGWSNSQVSAKLVDLGLVTPAQFEDALDGDYEFAFAMPAKPVNYEGYLFPDTYNFNATLDAAGIVQRMLDNFETKFTGQMLADMTAKGLDMREVTTMASIIEREVGRNGSVTITEEVSATMQRERELVASVFYNRLDIGMALQSDATVNYATGKSDRRALLSDLEVDSPYNTYANTGLPPGAIGNPGLGSIMAAIYPADSDYLYFLHDPAGVAYFGRSLEEHNANRAQYLD